MHDLMINLFKGYRATKDRQFVSYITDLEWEYNDGTEITAHRLMTHALNWYKDAKRKKQWEAPTAKQASTQGEMRPKQVLRAAEIMEESSAATTRTGDLHGKA